MGSKISVLADIDVDGTYVNLVVTGYLTRTNQQGLHPLIRQARALAPHGSIRADLRGAENVEDNAVESLRWAIDHKHDTGLAAGSVDILLPDEEPGQDDRDSGPRWLLGPWHDPQAHSASPPGVQMRETATMDTHDPTGPVPVPDPAPAATGGTGLESTEDFPTDVAGLSLTQLHVLHSKLCRQLDHETLTDPAGPHPLTQDRHQEVVAELDTRATTGPA